MLKNFILISFRSLMKNKLYVSINILGMAIAIGCCIIAYFAYKVDDTFDGIHVNGESIYRVTTTREFENQTTQFGYAPFALGAAIEQNIKDVDAVIRFHYSWSDVKRENDVFRPHLAYVDPSFFELFTFEFLSGNPSDLKDKTKIFINEDLAVRLFGTTDALGKMVTQVYGDKRKELEVGGVFKNQPQNSSFFQRESFLNFENVYDEFEMEKGSWKKELTIFLKINDPSRVANVLNQIQPYRENNNKVRDDFYIKGFTLTRFSEMAHIDRANKINAWMWDAYPIAAVVGSSVMAVLILLIACFNLTNTSIAISSRRLKEIGVRKVMGSMRSQLIVQFIGETLLVCMMSLLLGLVIADYLALGWNTMWQYMKLDLDYTQHTDFLIFLMGVLIFTGLAAGSYPALYISNFKPATILKGKLKFGGTNYFTRTLLGFQYAISLIAIVSAFAFVQNARYQREYDLGFNANGSIISYLHDANEVQTYRNALAENPLITTMAGCSKSIFANRSNEAIAHDSQQIEVDVITVGDKYLEAMDLNLIAGRDFQKDSQTDVNESVIITEGVAKLFGWNTPLGKTIISHDTVKLYVIGVIKDVYTVGLWAPLKPMMIRYIPPEDYRELIVSTKAENLNEVNAFMESTWKSIFPYRVYNAEKMDRVLSEVEEININIMRMYIFLGIVAMMMCGTGLFSLVSLNIIKRMKEIGVRKVLGASLANITRIINVQFFIILTIASVIGSFLSYFMVDMLMSSIWTYYQSATLSAFIFSIVLLFLISAVTVGFKIYNAASVNPVNTLRSE